LQAAPGDGLSLEARRSVSWENASSFPHAHPPFLNVPTLARHALIGAGVVLVQWLVLERLVIFGAAPDAVLLWVLWMSLTRGRQTGSLAGFAAGFLADIAYGPWVGLNMLLKTLAGFFGSWFPASQRELMILRPVRTFVVALVAALLHNGLEVLLVTLETSSRSLSLVTVDWLGSALYTAVLAFIAALFYGR
jgi:rod shape-determining protein MreD